MAEVEGLCGVEELDREDALGILHYLVAFGGGITTHADEVFLILAAGDAVDAAGGAELFALADDRGSCILRNHKAAIESGFGNQETGQATFGINELVCAAFADTA